MSSLWLRAVLPQNQGLRESISINMTACSAMASERMEPGEFSTGMPARVAAGISIMSTPVPILPTAQSSGHSADKSLCAGGDGCDSFCHDNQHEH